MTREYEKELDLILKVLEKITKHVDSIDTSFAIHVAITDLLQKKIERLEEKIKFLEQKTQTLPSLN